MKKDAEVQFYMRQRQKGTSQQLAAARAGMSERTARKYETKKALVVATSSIRSILESLSNFLAQKSNYQGKKEFAGFIKSREG